MSLDRILLQQSDRRRIPVEPGEIFYVEAEGHDTLVRLRGKRVLRDGRGLGTSSRSSETSNLPLAVLELGPLRAVGCIDVASTDLTSEST